MSLEDQKWQQLCTPQAPAPPPYRRNNKQHGYNNLVDLVLKAFYKPSYYCILIGITSFLLGYLSHSHSHPANSLLNNNSNQPELTASHDNRLSITPCTRATAIPPPPPPSDPSTSPDMDNGSDLTAHSTFPGQCAPPVASPDVRQTILSQVFNGVSPWEGFPPPHAAPLLLQEWTKGWGSRAAVFEHLITQVRPKTIIEVGTFLGASATHMAGLARKLGLEDTLIICIDDFRGWPGYTDEEKSVKMVNGDSMLLYQFMHNVVKGNVSESILFLPFSTSTALGGLCDWGVYGDLVEIDAAHDFHSAWVDINNGFKVLRRPGGVIFGHDYVWPGVRKAVHLFAKLHGFRVREDGEHWILY